MTNKAIDVLIKKLSPKAQIPFYATNLSAGCDLCALLENDLIVNPAERVLVPTGVAIALPKGFEAQIRSRSGLALKNGLVVLNSPGTIDADYRGEIKVVLINHGTEPFTITPGMRIAQMIVAKHETVTFVESEDLDQTERHRGGFGSTGLYVA
ncbi:MAG: Deoxyuridine 5'-triphosphate nucleotidohydrolase [Holosporales bacterium]